jgi:oligopeptidase B
MKSQARFIIRQFLALALTASFFSSLALGQNGSAPGVPPPPVPKRIPKEMVTHGDKRVDNYFWFREKSNPEVIAYLEAENAYADRVMKPTESFQQALYKEFLSHIKQTDTNVPVRLGNYYYYSRTVEGLQYPIYARRRGQMSAPEEITLDLNELAKGLKYLGLGAYRVSDDGNLLAYSTDTTGYRQYTLQVKDLRTGKLLAEKIERVNSVMWSTDNKTIFYGTEDPVTKRNDKFWRHELGTDKYELVYDEKDELYDVNAYRTRDKAFIILESESKRTTEIRYIPADRPTEVARVLLPRETDHKYFVDHRGDLFYIRTNQGALNYRLVTAPVRDPQKKNWKELIPHRPHVKLDDVNLFANFMQVTELEGGSQRMRIVDLRNNRSQAIEFPEPVYAVFADSNPEFDTSLFRYKYESLTTPPSVYDYNMETHQSTLLKRTEVPGYNSALYTSERAYATARDGTRIPLSLVYRKGMKRDGRSPLLLYGYGSYGYPIWPGFGSARLSLLDRGVTYVIAHIRGGGELGEPWRDAGRMMVKKNTFTDFIDAAEHLIKEKYTSSDRLVIEGGSAGGLLMGAVVNMRPDLFKAVVAHVPFVDVVNTMLDASLPLTTSEYLEWGNPNERAAYEYIKSYSPYDNITAKDYPAMLIKVSLNDSQVPYWEGAKFAARLRELKTDKNVLLLKTNMGAGHGGSSGRYDALKEVAFDYAFILMQMGITQ